MDEKYEGMRIDSDGKVEQSLLPSRALWHALGASVSANALDPRLGMPQPEGEPVGPRPMRRWVPIL